MLEILNEIKPVEFTYNEKLCKNDGKRHFGVIAQELNEIFPKEKYALVIEDNSGYLLVNYIELIPILIKAVQELSKELMDLKKVKEINNG